jgi:hypothetical protein
VPGTFAYTPVAGTVLPAGAAKRCRHLHADRRRDYTTATANVAITVLKATPCDHLAGPAAITYGTASALRS